VRASYYCFNGSPSKDVRDARDSQIEGNLADSGGSLIALECAADVSAESAIDFVVHDKPNHTLVDTRSVAVSGAGFVRLRPRPAGH
jgi:hypothetical protein